MRLAPLILAIAMFCIGSFMCGQITRKHELTECRADLEAEQGVWHTVECETWACESLFSLECPTGEWCRIVDGQVEVLP